MRMPPLTPNNRRLRAYVLTKTYPRDQTSATKNIFDKALAVPQGVKLEDCIENR